MNMVCVIEVNNATLHHFFSYMAFLNHIEFVLTWFCVPNSGVINVVPHTHWWCALSSHQQAWEDGILNK